MQTILFSICNHKILFVIILILLIYGCPAYTPPPEAVQPTPNEHQMAWHELEQYAFIHFTTNTFTGKEWGYGDEKPAIFSPTAFNAEQWVTTLKEVGLKGLILTCKHHDGFCLWPSRYTEHSVKNSPFREGRGDVVGEVSEACRKHGLLFGIYLSPWDRNFAGYGKPEYLTYYRNQLRELLENYDPVFEVWFDGANGGNGYYGGARERRRIDNTTYYDWPRTHQLVRELAPQAMMFSDAGPDIRWCGNERGFIGDRYWNMITNDTLYPGKANIGQLLNHGSEDGTSWVPAEVDVSIRPGWFYHTKEDTSVRTPENLFKIYMESVGRGASLLLNIPPDQRGLLHENDIQALKTWKKLIDEAFAVNLAAGAKASADSYRGNSSQYEASNATDGNKETYWATDDDIHTGSLTIELGKEQDIRYIVLQEYIRLGQRIQAFEIEAFTGNTWKPVADGSTIGYKRITPVENIRTGKIRVRIKEAKACPVISNIEVY